MLTRQRSQQTDTGRSNSKRVQISKFNVLSLHVIPSYKSRLHFRRPTKLINLPVKNELATDHVVYSLLLVNNFERPCVKQNEHFRLRRVHELCAMLTVTRLPERLGYAEVLGVAEGHVGSQVRGAHLGKSCVDILPRGKARHEAERHSPPRRPKRRKATPALPPSVVSYIGAPLLSSTPPDSACCLPPPPSSPDPCPCRSTRFAFRTSRLASSDYSTSSPA